MSVPTVPPSASPTPPSGAPDASATRQPHVRAGRRPAPRPEALAALVDALADNIATVVVGQSEVIKTAIAVFLAGGHLLIEDVPGLGKTTLALALARSFDMPSARIQFTADLLPADITGVSVYDQSTRSFQFHRGPIFASMVVADEINRATARTQSALLEAMGEGHVSVEGRSLALPDPFMVVATQNPLDMEGTHALPEAQRDRFMARTVMGYPQAQAEIAMLAARGGHDPLAALEPIASRADAVIARSATATIHTDPAVAAYVVALLTATRQHEALALGASPRAGLQLLALARAWAVMQGRGFVSPDDVAQAAPRVLPHRLVLRDRSVHPGELHGRCSDIVADIVARTPVPVG